MDHDLLQRRDDLSRDNQLRRQLDEATPSMGLAGVMMLAILVILGAVYLSPPASDTTSVAMRDANEISAPVPPSTP